MAEINVNSERKCPKCPKCKSDYGVFLSKNIVKSKSEVICFNGNCDFKMNILEWNDKYKEETFN